MVIVSKTLLIEIRSEKYFELMFYEDFRLGCVLKYLHSFVGLERWHFVINELGANKVYFLVLEVLKYNHPWNKPQNTHVATP